MSLTAPTGTVQQASTAEVAPQTAIPKRVPCNLNTVHPLPGDELGTNQRLLTPSDLAHIAKFVNCELCGLGIAVGLPARVAG